LPRLPIDAPLGQWWAEPQRRTSLPIGLLGFALSVQRKGRCYFRLQRGTLLRPRCGPAPQADCRAARPRLCPSRLAGVCFCV